MAGRISEIVRKAKQMATPGGSLTRQSIVGGGWVAALNVSDRVLQLAMVLVVARLIGPEAFGLMGIALLVISALNRFSRLGLDEALIYNNDDDVDKYLNTALSLNITRGTIVAAIAFLSAPFVASFFSEPRAELLIKVLAITPFLQGIRNPGIVYFRKDLDFEREYVYKMSGAVAQFIVAVSYALVFQTVWALVLASVAKRAVLLLSSYLIHPYRPKPAFDLGLAKELVDYGKWMWGSSVVGFLSTQGDDAFLGWMLNATSLGVYQVAYRFGKAPNTEVTHVISRVAFPAYSQLSEDIDRLRAAFYRTVKVTLFIALPAGIGIAAVAPTFIRAFLGTDWLPAILPLQILALYGTSVAFGSMFGEVWKAIGRPDVNTKFLILNLVSTAVLIYPLTARYGVVGTALTVAFTEFFITRPLSLVVTARLIDASKIRLLRELAFPLIASLGMGATVWLLRQQLALGSPFVEFVILVAVGIVVYATLAGLLETQFDWGLRSEYRSIRVELSGGTAGGSASSE